MLWKIVADISSCCNLVSLLVRELPKVLVEAWCVKADGVGRAVIVDP